jgi:type IV secretory pathway protease TraF
VQVTESGLLINGVYQKNSTQFAEADGVKLYPLPVGWKYTLKQGDYFLMGQSLHSIDSRYFGVVNKSLIYRRVILIWHK